MENLQLLYPEIGLSIFALLLMLADVWTRPRFPLSGRDVMRAGVPEGPLVGKVLGEVEKWWIDGDFAADEASLAERLKAAARVVAH